MEEQKAQPTNNNRRKKIAVTIFAVVLILGAVTGYIYVQYKKTHITTDDAFIDGDIHTIASKVDGTVINIYVRDNQFVKKGDMLLELDPVDYEVKVKEAQSALGAEKAKLAEVDAKIGKKNGSGIKCENRRDKRSERKSAGQSGAG